MIKGLRDAFQLRNTSNRVTWHPLCQVPHATPYRIAFCVKQKEDKIASAVLNTLLKHLWYLSEKLMALAFFYSAVSHEIKVKMEHTLQKPVDSKSIKRTSRSPESPGEKDCNISLLSTQKDSLKM